MLGETRNQRLTGTLHLGQIHSDAHRGRRYRPRNRAIRQGHLLRRQCTQIILKTLWIHTDIWEGANQVGVCGRNAADEERQDGYSG